jgi:hypothetical protein
MKLKLSKDDIKNIKNIAKEEQFSNRTKRIYDFKIIKKVRDWVYISYRTNNCKIKEIVGYYGDYWRFIMTISKKDIIKKT